jgi:hypothetical protein
MAFPSIKTRAVLHVAPSEVQTTRNCSQRFRFDASKMRLWVLQRVLQPDGIVGNMG